MSIHTKQGQKKRSMQAGMKRKFKYESNSSDGESSSDDETWSPGSSYSSSPSSSSLQEEEGEVKPTAQQAPSIRTRSRGPVERPSEQANSAMDTADAVVDNESDLSSDTEEEEEEEESYDEEEEEEESEDDEEEDYSDDDSFVTSNEDADREERDEVVRSYGKVFNGSGGEEEEEPEVNHSGEEGFVDGHFIPTQAPEEDLSIGGYVVGTEGGEM